MSVFFAMIVSIRPRTRFRRLSLFDPDRRQQFIDMAGPDISNRQAPVYWGKRTA